MKKRIFATALAMILAISTTQAALAQEGQPEDGQPEADEVIEGFRKAVDELESFSFTSIRTDYGDEFIVERHKEAMKSYEPILSKLEFLTRKSLMPEIRKEYKNVGHYKIVKPFLIEVDMEVNEYLPELLYGSIAYYRPDIKEEIISMKEPMIGLVFKRPTDNDSATVMVDNWIYDLVELDCTLANGGAGRITGTEEVDGKEVIVLEVELKGGKEDWKFGCGEKDYGIPESARVQINAEMGMTGDRLEMHDEEVKIKLWIDAENMLVVKKEMLIGEKTFTTRIFENIGLNSVKKEGLRRP